jgi:hypothetical protein
MQKSIFTLADVIALLGILVYGFFFYLSMNFLTMGQTSASVIWSMTASFILGVLAFGVKRVKRTSKNFKTFIILEWTLILIYIVVATLFMGPFSHYFNVSQKKESIQKVVLTNIVQAEGLFGAYETYANNRINVYAATLNSVVVAEQVDPETFSEFGFVAETNRATQIENKVFALKAQLYPSNYLSMKSSDSIWLAETKSKITNWSPLGVVSAVNALSTETSSWNEQLKSFSAFRANGEVLSNFEYELTFNDVQEAFIKRTSPSFISLIIGVGLNFLVFLPYFITNRHPRFPGFKVVFSTVGRRENKL